MDIYIGNYRFSTYFSTLAAMEANSLMNTAVAVSAFHLSDALTRIRFQEEVKTLRTNNYFLSKEALVMKNVNITFVILLKKEIILKYRTAC